MKKVFLAMLIMASLYLCAAWHNRESRWIYILVQTCLVLLVEIPM